MQNQLNHPPSIGGTPAGEVPAGQSYAFIPTAADADGDALIFSIVSQPDWTRFDTSSGKLTGSPNVEHIGLYSDITITVCDTQFSCSTMPAFSIKVIEIADVSDNASLSDDATPLDDINPPGDGTPLDDANPPGNETPLDDANPPGDETPPEDANPVEDPSQSNNISSNCTDSTVHCVDDNQGQYQEFSVIQAAVNSAGPGELVLIYPGAYAGFEVSISGAEGRQLTIMAASQGVTINAPVSDGESTYGILIRNADFVTLDGFFVDGNAFAPLMGIAARDATAESPMQGLIIRNNTVRSAESTNIYLSQTSNSLIEGNISSGSRRSHGIYLSNAGSDDTILRGNRCFDNDVNGIHFNGDRRNGGDGIISGLMIEDNIIYANGENGLNMDGVRQSVIRNNLVYKNARHPLRAYRGDAAGGPDHLSIINNTFITSNAYGWPVRLTADGGGHIIFNNILINRGSNGSISVGNRNLFTAANLVENMFSLDDRIYDLNGWQQQGYGEGSILAEPEDSLFVDPNADNYRLTSGSAAVDQGRDTLQGISAPTRDINHIHRPQSNGCDVGAFEYVP